jgi:hypothetical protein
VKLVISLQDGRQTVASAQFDGFNDVALARSIADICTHVVQPMLLSLKQQRAAHLKGEGSGES